MNRETPLEEVARHLPTEVAQVMIPYSYPVQESVLRQTRSALTGLEEMKAMLDPVQMEAFLTVFVGSIAPLTDALHRIGREGQ